MASLSPSSYSFFFLLLLSLFHSPASAAGRFRLPPKPDPADAHATARWLASQNFWGVLSTISSDLGGAPFGNVVSYSDGVPGDGRGVPYFYLTQLDPTARDALKDQRASFSISEFPLGTCKKIDPENPTCAKLTLSGKLKPVEGNSTDGAFAIQALFTKHPEMKTWPKNHGFQIFKLDIENLFLIDWFGGPKPLSPAQYLSPGKHVVSYSDGVPGDGRGVPYFYLTQLDPTARDALKDRRASFAISELPLGTCNKIDPENPTCAKLTLPGKLKSVESNSSDGAFALRALFAKHPEMKTWPKNHKFQIFKLDIENLFLIDWFGGAKPLSPDQYLSSGMDLNPSISAA